MARSILPFHKCKRSSVFLAHPLRSTFLGFLSVLAFPLLFALPPQQFPVNLRDLFKMIFDLVVVLDPTPHLVYLFSWNDTAGRTSTPQGDGQIPHWPMPLAFGAPAGGVAAGDVSFHQRTAQGFGDRRKLLGQTLPALAQGQFRQSF